MVCLSIFYITMSIKYIIAIFIEVILYPSKYISIIFFFLLYIILLGTVVVTCVGLLMGNLQTDLHVLSFEDGH